MREMGEQKKEKSPLKNETRNSQGYLQNLLYFTWSWTARSHYYRRGKSLFLSAFIAKSHSKGCIQRSVLTCENGYGSIMAGGLPSKSMPTWKECESFSRSVDCTFVFDTKDETCFEEEFFSLFSVFGVLFLLTVIYLFDMVFPMVVLSSAGSTFCVSLQSHTTTLKTGLSRTRFCSSVIFLYRGRQNMMSFYDITRPITS